MKTKDSQAEESGKHQLIIKEWQRLGGEPIGQAELCAIQQALRETLGENAVEGPAMIARRLADLGADLRHPEVIEFDAKWRAAEIEKQTRIFRGLERLVETKPLCCSEAQLLIKRLEEARRNCARSKDEVTEQHLRDLAISARRTAQSLANDSHLSRAQRDEQEEIAQWLAVWLQSPALFADWLDLRIRSADFRRRFCS